MIEGQVVAELEGQYAVGYSVPTFVAESATGETSELEISWDQVPFVQRLLARSLPPDRVFVNLRPPNSR